MALLLHSVASALVHVPLPKLHFPPPRNYPVRRSVSPPKIQLNYRSILRNSFGRIGGENASEDKKPDEMLKDAENKNQVEVGRNSFLLKLALAVGVAVAFTFVSIGMKSLNQGSRLGIQYLADASSSSAIPHVGFSFQAFGYRVLLPEYAPGWLYFWLLMAAGCGLFISEEALNIWVGASLSRLLSLDGTWQSFVSSFSSQAPYIVATILWVYWGVCISDMIPFYFGKLFGQANASDEVYTKLGIGKEKVLNITEGVRKYGNLIGFVERFSIGMRNPTAFVAGALGISPERFFAGVCLGGLITLPIQLAIGFLLRERPMFAIATVATAVGVWTLFPYVVAASTALFLFLRNRIST